MVWSSLAPKWPILVPFCGMDHQKSNFSLISDTLSVGGCWGQPMSFFWKLVDETQIFLTPEATRHHNSIKSLILLPLRANLLYVLHYETPCSELGHRFNFPFCHVSQPWTSWFDLEKLAKQVCGEIKWNGRQFIYSQKSAFHYSITKGQVL